MRTAENIERYFRFVAAGICVVATTAPMACSSATSVADGETVEDGGGERTDASSGADAGKGTDAATAQPLSATLDGVELHFRKVSGYFASDRKTPSFWISATNGVDGENPFNWESLYISFPGGIGPHDCTANGTGVSYSTPDVGKSFAAGAGVVPSNCSIQVTEVGAVGGRIRGTYSASIRNDKEADFHRIAGSFDVAREPDQP